MKLGIGLPTYYGNLIRPETVLEIARRAEAAGFDALTVHDKPNHDTWEPMVALAAVGAVTTRIRLLTAAILLPARDEVLLAKQAAVVDVLTGGRLELGVAVGVRPDDFELMGRPYAGRGPTFTRQVERMLELWKRGAETRETGAAMGPSPEHGRPRLWLGGYQPVSVDRAVRYGDGYILGAPGLDAVRARLPEVRQRAAAAGRPDFPVGALAYVVASTDPAVVAEAERVFVRYYGPLQGPFNQRARIGDGAAVRDLVAAYAEAGLDELHLLPIGSTTDQVDLLASEVLPAARLRQTG